MTAWLRNSDGSDEPLKTHIGAVLAWLGPPPEWGCIKCGKKLSDCDGKIESLMSHVHSCNGSLNKAAAGGSTGSKGSRPTSKGSGPMNRVQKRKAPMAATAVAPQKGTAVPAAANRAPKRQKLSPSVKQECMQPSYIELTSSHRVHVRGQRMRIHT